MQKYSFFSNPEDRRLVRRWRMCVLAFYGSVISVLVLWSALSGRPTETAVNTGRPATTITASK